MIGFPFDSHVTFDVDGTPIYDRAITSDPYRKLLKTLFTNGILPDVSTNLQVMAKEGLTLSVLSGFAMVEGCMKLQEKDLTITLDPGDSLPRIDRVVMRLDVNDDVRACELAIIKGTPATSPIAPNLVRSSSVYDICLAAVTVNSNTQEIINANIEDTRYDDDVCGVISSLSKFDTSSIYLQIQSDLEEFKRVSQKDYEDWTDSEKEAWVGWVTFNENSFTEWYNKMKDQLSQDVAGHLQLEIDELQLDVVLNYFGIKASKTTFVDDEHIEEEIGSDFKRYTEFSTDGNTITERIMKMNGTAEELLYRKVTEFNGDVIIETVYDAVGEEIK